MEKAPVTRAPTQSVHQNLLGYKMGRYGVYSLVLLLISMGLYLSQSGVRPPSGNTWQGYVLGGIASTLIIFLILLGVRKRRYRANWGSVQGWTSAHIYLGTLVLIIVALHAGFQVGWNIHTFAYALMMIVCVSGFFGLWFYQRYPEVLVGNLGGSDPEVLLGEVNILDAKIESLSLKCPEPLRQRIEQRLAEARFASGFWARLCRKTTEDDLVTKLSEHIGEFQQAQARGIHELVLLFVQREKILDNLRRFLQIKALLKLWLWFHVPCSFGLVAAVITHVVSVFYYW